MQEMRRESLAEVQPDIEPAVADRSEETGVEAADVLAHLERRVKAAVAVIENLREERDGLRRTVAERDTRIRELEAGAQSDSGLEREIEALRRQRDDLRRDRAQAMHRVESILEKLNGLDLG